MTLTTARNRASNRVFPTPFRVGRGSQLRSMEAAAIAPPVASLVCSEADRNWSWTADPDSVRAIVVHLEQACSTSRMVEFPGHPIDDRVEEHAESAYKSIRHMENELRLRTHRVS